MSEFVGDEQTPPASVGGAAIVWPDSVSKFLAYKNSAGRAFSIGGEIRNWNTADVVANAVDTYLAGSALAVPPHLLQAGTTFRWRMIATKTGAGVATPIWNVRVGTLGTIVDAARLVFTGPVQTAVIDTAIIEITAILRNTGLAGVLAGGLTLNHNLAATGFANIANPTLAATSAGFDTTLASLIVGLSVNPGAAGVWTHTLVAAEMLNI
jgi:hypothetical protein